MVKIRAICENGVFRPLDPIDFLEGTEVQLPVLRFAKEHADQNMDAIYEVMDRRHNTGEPHLAARHHEHQP